MDARIRVKEECTELGGRGQYIWVSWVVDRKGPGLTEKQGNQSIYKQKSLSR